MFTFSTAGRVVVGAGAAAQVPQLVRHHGSRVLLVVGRHTDTHAGPLVAFEAATVVRASGEPTVESVEAALALARATRPDVVVGWGGGSVIDLAKSVAILVASEHRVLDHLEVIGQGVPLPGRSLPVVAVPTTAGTGAEVTANAPVLSPAHGVKASLRSPAMLPAAAVVDPELTLGCPPEVTASSGLDALTQCLEPFTSLQANPVSDALAREGLARCAAGLQAAYWDGANLAARTDMSIAALLSGMALASSKLGAVHGIAAPLGGLTGAPHGEACAAVLAATTETNLAALLARAPHSPALPRYAEAARLLTGDPRASAADGVAWLRSTVAELGVRGLDALGLDRADHGRVADAALVSSSMAGNPVKLTRSEVLGILERSA